MRKVYLGSVSGVTVYLGGERHDSWTSCIHSTESGRWLVHLVWTDVEAKLNWLFSYWSVLALKVN